MFPHDFKLSLPIALLRSNSFPSIINVGDLCIHSHN